MANPIPYWGSDKDYYTHSDPNKKSHLQRIKDNLSIDNLIKMASSDSSYSITIK